MRRKTSNAILAALLFLGLLLLLCACGAAGMQSDMSVETAPSPAVPSAAPTIGPTPVPTTEVLGVSYPMDTETLDLSAMSEDDTEEAAAALSAFPALREVNLLDEEGNCALLPETIGRLAAAAPQIHFRCSLPLWGETLLSDAEEVTFSDRALGEEELAELEEVLPLLRCSRFALSRCRVDNEAMAALRSRFPERGIAWDIRVNGYWHMSDCERIRTTIINNDCAGLLKYFTEVRYLDVGHKFILTDFEFLRSMPHLQVAILAMTGLTDLSPLENCTELEYLEVFTTYASDLSPLANLTKLKHLNISNMPLVKDVTPLKSLTSLVRLRAVQTYVPQEQIDELTALLPDCNVQFQGYGPTSGGWRTDSEGEYTERYAQLREEMDYDITPWPDSRW